MKLIGNDWDNVLGEEYEKTYFNELISRISEQYATKNIFPPKNRVFAALKLTPYASVRVVILGQDPYHEKGQAQGISFSVPVGEKIPPSLVNIFKELNTDIGCYIPNNGNLIKWCKQGVLMLNTVLTVQEGMANSHKGWGWEKFTDAVIRKLNDKDEPIVFLLWGRNAISKKALITNKKHLVLETVHPSPLSAFGGFFGCKHFSRANKFLIENGLTPIDWQIENKK